MLKEQTLQFKSVSTFLINELQKVKEADVCSDTNIIIKIASDAENFLDLYNIGRFIAICRMLKACNYPNVTVDFLDIKKKRASNLCSLGLFELLKQEGIKVSNAPVQMRLLEGVNPIGSKVYWNCLVPLRKIKISSCSDETLALTTTYSILDDISEILMQALGEVSIPITDVSRELHKILFGIFRELILNVVMHSESQELIVALAIDRESSSTSGRSHRSGFVVGPGQDKYHFLLLDFGRGLLASVQQQLAPDLQPLAAQVNSYNSLNIITDSLLSLRQKEASLLNSVFNGNLVIRKGRKSEGLHDVGEKLAWFGGILNYRTGRTELEMRHGDSSGYSRDIRVEPQRAYFLPGVIAAGLLPSHSLKILTVKSSLGGVQSSLSRSEIPLLESFSNLPKGLFGGRTVTEIRRRCELYTREFVEEYSENVSRTGSKPFFMCVDLACSNNISVPFLDTLLQELCKGGDSLTASHPLKRIFFINCPRNIIQALRERTCASFLKLFEAFCLILDEDDKPHFLGTSRILKTAFDIDEVLMASYLKHDLAASYIEEYWNVTSEDVANFKRFFSTDRRDLFFRIETPNALTFCCHRLADAVTNWRTMRINRAITLAQSQTNQPSKLESSYAEDELLKSLRADHATLREFAGMLFRRGNLSPVNSVISFIGNGDILASQIHIMMDASKFLLLDPNRSEWPALTNIIEGPAMIVMGRLDAGISLKVVEPFLNQCNSIAQIPVICCILDARQNRTDKIGDSKVVALLSPNQMELPMGEPNFEASLDLTSSTAKEKIHNSLFRPYYDVELSAEFWHNVSTLKIITSRDPNRDKRSAIFYEHSERIIENRRTRLFLEEFVLEFVRDRLRLDVDVIIHPNHPVGAFLAHLAARLLNAPPLIIPIKQTHYGGKLEVSENDFEEVRKLVASHSSNLKRVNLSAILFDDSVFTGSSLFSMIGLSEGLGLKIKGILVLLNRLPTQISDAMSSLPYPFSYLYRLHMPLTSESQSPDVMLREWSQALTEQTHSFYVEKWCQVIRHKGRCSYLFGDAQDIDSSKALEIAADPFRQPIKCPKPHEIKQIIQGLILHPDVRILDFETRIAVAYNFMERLVSESVFWELLSSFSAIARSAGKETNEAHFVRKLFLLLAVSPHVRKREVYETLEDACWQSLLDFSSDNQWVAFRGFIADAYLTLGMLGSSRLFECLPRLAIMLRAGLCSEDRSCYLAAEHLAACFAWACSGRLLILNKEPDGKVLSSIKKCFASMEDNEELELAMLDMLSSYLLGHKVVRDALGVEVWEDQDRFLDELKAEDAEMFAYLIEAPGYSFTLYSLLMLCKATTVLLFARNETDEHYFLRMYQTRGGIKASDNLSISDLTDESFGKRVLQKMESGMFFVSSASNEVSVLDRFRDKVRLHSHILGKEIRIGAGTTRYYLILGYSDDQIWNTLFIRTTVLYLLKAAEVLNTVLPAIHEKHIVSSTAWNVLMQSISPIHPIGDRRNPRRIQLQHAMSLVDLAQLLRKAVEISRQVPMTQLEILKTVNDVQNNLKQRLSETNQHALVPDEHKIPTERNSWPVHNNTKNQELPDGGQYYSFPATIFEFVLYECLCNALASYESRIDITLNFADSTVEPGASYSNITLNVRNDCPQPPPPTRIAGIAACKKAADAVHGMFDSRYDMANKLWIATLTLKARRVPQKLTRYLRACLP